ncbi:cardiolipin synthetase [Escherichia coli]|nr:cardiolipin synthetase [Escherichia coli]
MRNAGIEVVEALKVNLMRVFLRRMDLRQHRKMIMIDNYIAYTGSMIWSILATSKQMRA